MPGEVGPEAKPVLRSPQLLASTARTLQRTSSDPPDVRQVEDAMFTLEVGLGFSKGRAKIRRHNSRPAKGESECSWPGRKAIFPSTSLNKRTHSRNSWGMTSEVLG